MNYVLATKDPLNEWDAILIYYVMDFSKSQKLKLFKKTFYAFKNLFKKHFFYNIFLMFIASWLEIGNGKKCYFQYNLNIHILN